MLTVQSLTNYLKSRLSLNSTWLVTSRLYTTRHVRRVEPMHFGCVELVEQHHAQHTRQDELDRHDLQFSLLCNLCRVRICKLIYWSIHLVNLFHMTQQIGQEHKRLNLYRRAYNLFVVRHVGTSTARRARHNERVESCRLWRCDVTKLVEFGPFLACRSFILTDATYNATKAYNGQEKAFNSVRNVTLLQCTFALPCKMATTAVDIMTSFLSHAYLKPCNILN